MKFKRSPIKRMWYNSMWRWRFAIFPTVVGENYLTIWLRWYELRGGRKYEDFVEYRFEGKAYRMQYILEY